MNALRKITATLACGLMLTAIATTAPAAPAKDRASAIRECNQEASKFLNYTWGNQDSEHYRACMAEHRMAE